MSDLVDITIKATIDPEDLLPEIPGKDIIVHVLFHHLDAFFEISTERMSASPDCFEKAQAIRLLANMPAFMDALRLVVERGEPIVPLPATPSPPPPTR